VEFGFQRVNVAAQRRDPTSLWHAIRKMIAARKQHRAFGRGACEFLATGNNAVLAYVRTFEDETILVVNNLSASPQTISLDRTRWANREMMDLNSHVPLPHLTNASPSVTLAPYQFLWLG
jgi:maltose alpha-D-glucosyltransferase/alpha-amylase